MESLVLKLSKKKIEAGDCEAGDLGYVCLITRAFTRQSARIIPLHQGHHNLTQKNTFEGWAWWVISIIPALQEERRRIVVV
jgi:hypothetical protein